MARTDPAPPDFNRPSKVSFQESCEVSSSILLWTPIQGFFLIREMLKLNREIREREGMSGTIRKLEVILILGYFKREKMDILGRGLLFL